VIIQKPGKADIKKSLLKDEQALWEVNMLEPFPYAC
jgi:hypothetical protein